MAGEVSFFELGAGDPEQARTFYGSMFGWTFDPGPTDDGGGYAIRTPNVPGGLHGGEAGASRICSSRSTTCSPLPRGSANSAVRSTTSTWTATNPRSPGSAASSSATTTRAPLRPAPAAALRMGSAEPPARPGLLIRRKALPGPARRDTRQ
ncbi:hypothetical protein NKH18_06055 [Streptomyces sp. M10(2022)]